MPDCSVCNVCDCPGTLANSPETARVASNVRKFQQDEFTVWRCANCGSLHRLEDADLEYYYQDYFLQQHQLDFFTRRGYGNRLRLLRKHGLARDASILDYGCGRGVFVSFLRQRGLGWCWRRRVCCSTPWPTISFRCEATCWSSFAEDSLCL